MKSGGTDRNQYWKLRSNLSDRMQALVKSVEERWLGSARAWLLGSFSASADEEVIDSILKEAVQLLKTKLSPRKVAELRVILSAASTLRPQELMSELRTICRGEIEADLVSVYKLVQSRLQLNGKRNPVILILDPDLQAFPWESIPALYDARQPVSRVPSLQFLRWEKSFYFIPAS
jgi:Peptidase family C50